MTTHLGPAVEPRPAAMPAAGRRSVPRAGWLVVARKEFGDHLLSARFSVLVIVLGLAAAIPLYFAAEAIRLRASDIAGAQAVFIALFWLAPEAAGQLALPSAAGFLAYVAPLLGLAFAFDAVNGERAQGTLPYLLSQPIHRDDVINGKFAAGLGVIGLVLASVVGFIGAVGLIQLGITPSPVELLRILLWVLLTFLYVALWLAFATLLSVVVRRAATSALIGFGTWLLLTFFGGLITSLLGGFLAPLSGGPEEILRNNAFQETLARLMPDTLYREASLVLLNPQVTDVSTPSTVAGYEQAAQRIPSLLSLDQSFTLVWPQVVALVALTVGCFALAYVRFMRQEVRA